MAKSEGKMRAIAMVAVVTMSMFFLPAGATEKLLPQCMPEITDLIPCLDCITGNTTAPTTPSNDCCEPLGKVLRTRPSCLCAILDGEVSNTIGIDIDKDRALALPLLCHLQTPPVSECDAFMPPDSSAPSPAPAGAPPTPSPSRPSTQPPPASGAPPTPSGTKLSNRECSCTCTSTSSCSCTCNSADTHYSFTSNGSHLKYGAYLLPFLVASSIQFLYSVF